MKKFLSITICFIASILFLNCSINDKSMDSNRSVQKTESNLDAEAFKILNTKHNESVQNFRVLIKTNKFDKDSISELINLFRKQNCEMNCNINVYDSKIIIPYLDKYPLDKKEYLLLADHFVASSTFDAPELTSWYPFQDFQYKEYGGKNWKKEPIK